MALPTPPPPAAPLAWRQAYRYMVATYATYAVEEARQYPTATTIGNARRILFYLNNFAED